MMQYSYNKMIMIIINAIILDFLFARFVYADAPKLTILSFFNKSQNLRITEANKLLNLPFSNENFFSIYSFS